jgi:glycosyltransferase involved in cell wall biosynthesis
MRVLQLGKYYYPYMGGIETHLYELCTRLGRSHEVQAVVCNSERSTVRERMDGVDLTRVGTLGRSASTEICPALPFELSRRTYDVLHLHTPNPMGMLAYLTARKPARHGLVVTHHSDIVRQAFLRRAFEPVFHRVMSRADVIIATSRRYLESSAELRPYRAKCVVIPYGVDTTGARASQSQRVAELRSRYGSRVVLAVGRLIYYKGFAVLIEAMVGVDGTLLIVGDGPLHDRLMEQVKALGLEGRVFLLGGIHNHEIGDYYTAADVFAFPSIARSEAFGMVQLEAMLAGLPVVNTLLDSGVPEVSVHEETGLTVQPGDVPALAAALECLLSTPELARKYGAAGQRRVPEFFDADVMTSRVIQAYRRVLPEERGSGRAA